MRTGRIVVLVAALAAAVLAVTQWVSSRRAAVPAEGAPQPARPVPLVRTATLQPARLVESSTYPGDVRASRSVDVFSRVAGRLGAVLVKEGSAIGAGGLLARIEDPEAELALLQTEAAADVQRARLAQLRAGARAQEIAQAEASVSQAEVSLAQAERDLTRTQHLFTEGLVARATVDRAQTDVELARARLRAAREQLALVRQGPRTEDIAAQAAQLRQAEAAVATARARLRELSITSPIGGVLTRLNVEPGEVISTQTVVATVETIRPIEVWVQLPEIDLPRLRPTSAVRISVDALPGRVIEGTIARVAPSIDAASRSARLVISVPNTDLALRPGMFARTTIVFDERQAIVVPLDAIVRRGARTVVFVVQNDVAIERAVRLGFVDGARTEIVDGLRPGDVIVTVGQQGLRDGARVRTGPGGGPGRRQRPPGAPVPGASPGGRP